MFLLNKIFISSKLRFKLISIKIVLTVLLKKQDDIIIDFNGEPVKEADDLHKYLTEDQINIESKLTVIRGSKKVILDIILEELKY